jgi:NAD dependent epimerase/dehydratase family enzyme
MTFMGEKLTEKQKAALSKFLKERLSKVEKDIDQHIDLSGRLILTDKWELQNKLKRLM